MPGPALSPSTTLSNALVIADSVSIGYTGTAAKNLSDIALLQHGPYDTSDGGAGSTLVGQTCLDNFLVTQAQVKVDWDVILFNFGLHDMVPNTLDEYRQQLTNITTRLVETGAKLIYATTTPFMPAFSKGSTIVETLNGAFLLLVLLFVFNCFCGCSRVPESTSTFLTFFFFFKFPSLLYFRDCAGDHEESNCKH
jgi:hypothetical protein